MEKPLKETSSVLEVAIATDDFTLCRMSGMYADHNCECEPSNSG